MKIPKEMEIKLVEAEEEYLNDVSLSWDDPDYKFLSYDERLIKIAQEIYEAGYKKGCLAGQSVNRIDINGIPIG